MATQAKILIVDDEAHIRFGLSETLERDGYKVVTVENGTTALALIANREPFDVALIDLRLPDMSGMDILAELREQMPDVAVIMLTAHASLETAVEALKQGAHDYLFKPAKTTDLRESVRRGLRKRQKALKQQKLLQQLEGLSKSFADLNKEINDDPNPDEIMREAMAGDKDRILQRSGLTVDFLRHMVTLDNVLLELSPTEFNLLAYLISEAPRVIPPQELIREVHGYESDPREAGETLRYHIYRLRQKIKLAFKGSGKSRPERLIKTVRSVGYTIAE